MSSVNTVLGLVDSGELGVTMMHEHVLTAFPGWQLDPDFVFERTAVMGKVVRKLMALKEAGCGTFVDVTPVTLARDSGFLREASQRSGLHIVAATGLYKDPGIPFHFDRFWDIDKLADLFVRDITQGMDGTDVKAGIIKVGTSLGRITEAEQKVLRAAARAQCRTGVPITTHTDGSTMGREQLDICEQEGADLGRVIVGHSDGILDLNYHRGLMRRGAYVGFDRTTRDEVSDRARALQIKTLVEEGFGRQIVLSIDAQLHWLWPPGFNERDHTQFLRGFVPLLREVGLSQQAIDALLIENPRAVLGVG